ncbi:hypothetical protein RSPO_c01482 [Ralstonia solanacearum Po82]|uniref:Uncharacterized protein n=1 Tax=Ralstonia solanacearum (strain Po82) TaxID=1031711 RepID=F6G153_RALS8|nr:hypothetical protein RSPO_c01482 [Ralstonia solanacearum Po82]
MGGQALGVHSPSYGCAGHDSGPWLHGVAADCVRLAAAPGGANGSAFACRESAIQLPGRKMPHSVTI